MAGGWCHLEAILLAGPSGPEGYGIAMRISPIVFEGPDVKEPGLEAIELGVAQKA